MNAYRAYDRIEDRRWVEQQLTDEKEKWIDDRAKEIIDMFPKSPRLNHSLFLSDEACLALMGDKAQEAYNDFISTCAYARAEEEWQRKEPCPF
ncbi:MAG: host nuclease inhibitor GamL [Enterobacteriaceae bacterium]|nr:host nuclease inhibitor GamL [Enterobacteriaceae bacterium]